MTKLELKLEPEQLGELLKEFCGHDIHTVVLNSLDTGDFNKLPKKSKALYNELDNIYNKIYELVANMTLDEILFFYEKPIAPWEGPWDGISITPLDS